MEKKDATSNEASSTEFDYSKLKTVQHSFVPWNCHVESGFEVLRNPRHNKGLGFSWDERIELKLHGLLPPVYRDIKLQAKEVIWNFDRIDSDIDKYMYIMDLLERNEKLFYYVLSQNLEKIMPIVYTPTVGKACQKFGYIFENPHGLWITIKDMGRIYQMLQNWPGSDVRAICVTDGERILGLGDLGAFGMGIPIGKLALYTSCGGIQPKQLLPILLDVGTNNDDLRSNEFYIGIREKRTQGSKYDEFLEEFMHAVSVCFGPTTLVQFEDFGNNNAFRLLDKFRDKFCCFNDDIQGTAVVTLAGFLASFRIKDIPIKSLYDHVILITGAGSAGVGIADLISLAIARETGKSEQESRKNIWLVDSKGLIFKDRPSGGLNEFKKRYAHLWNGPEIKDLAEIAKLIKATAIIGVSGQPGSFSEKVCKALMKNNPRPIIFPMSNPTDKSECTAKQAFEWTNNNVIFASGSPFDEIKLSNDKKIRPSQANNSYVFPGIALGIIACKSSRVTDEMFLNSAYTLSKLTSENMLENGEIYPPIEKSLNISFEIACTVVEESFKKGLTQVIPPNNIRDLVNSIRYNALSYDYFDQKVFSSIKKDYENY